MAISSIHFAAGHSGYFDHNSREAETNNAIFKDEKNYCSANKKEAFELFKKELALRTEAYTERTGQKLQKSTTTHLSAIFNFNKDTTPEQAHKVCEYLEKVLDTKVVQLAMHRDEGHIIEADSEAIHDSLKKEIAIKNYHGHIEMLGIDSQGNSIRKKLDKPMLRQIQTDVAKILDMERGRETSYTKEEYEKIMAHMLPKEEYETKRDYNRAFGYFAKELGLYKAKKSKRLDTYEYKEMAKQRGEAVKELEKELKQELAKAKDLQEINKELRAELKEAAATREDYAKLEQLNKDLKEQIKAKALSIDDLHQQIEAYKKEKEHYKSIVEIQEIEIIDLKKDIDISQTNRNTPKTNENNLNDKSIEKKEKAVLDSLKDDFNYEMEKTEKGIIKKTYGVELKEKFNQPPNVADLSLFNRVKNKMIKAYDIIKEQAIKILNLEKENQELKEKVKDLQIKVSTQQKQLSKEKSEHSILNSEKKEIKTQEEPITFDNAMDFIKNEMLKEEQKKPFKLKEKDKSNQPRRNQGPGRG